MCPGTRPAHEASRSTYKSTMKSRFSVECMENKLGDGVHGIMEGMSGLTWMGEDADILVGGGWIAVWTANRIAYSLADSIEKEKGRETRLVVFFWNIFHQSMGNVFISRAKKQRSCFMSCQLTSRLEGEGLRNFRIRGRVQGSEETRNMSKFRDLHLFIGFETWKNSEPSFLIYALGLGNISIFSLI